MKYKRWHQPLRNRVPLPKLSSNSRVVNVSMMERVTSLVKGGVMHKPLWYDAMLAHPPPKKAKAPRPMRLEWEDDRLRRLYLARNPAATLQPKALFLDPRRPEADMEHEANAFVRHQKALMRKGATEEEAYRTVRRQQQEAAARAREEEERVAQQQAAEIGARRGGGGGKVPYSVTQQLFRRLAEEAREAGEPYPKHWFADGGAGDWVGIGSVEMVKQLQGVAQQAVAKTDTDVSAIAAMLSGSSLRDAVEEEESDDRTK